MLCAATLRVAKLWYIRDPRNAIPCTGTGHSKAAGDGRDPSRGPTSSLGQADHLIDAHSISSPAPPFITPA